MRMSWVMRCFSGHPSRVSPGWSTGRPRKCLTASHPRTMPSCTARVIGDSRVEAERLGFNRHDNLVGHVQHGPQYLGSRRLVTLGYSHRMAASRAGLSDAQTLAADLNELA